MFYPETMSPLREELELGWKAYRQVRSFEKNKGKSFYPQLGVFVIMLGLLGVTFVLVPDHPSRLHDYGELAIIVMPWAVVALFRQYRADQELCAQNRLLLRLLKEKHGDTLPWLVEEKQLTRARELEIEIAKTNHA